MHESVVHDLLFLHKVLHFLCNVVGLFCAQSPVHLYVYFDLNEVAQIMCPYVVELLHPLYGKGLLL